MSGGKKALIIGSGFSGLSCACVLAKQGYSVEVIEKNATPGGRARAFACDGFTFDMGPTWYWMPDIFEDFFSLFDKKTSDYYQLTLLQPSYRVFFGVNDFVDVSNNQKQLFDLFEQLEPGSSSKLADFLKEAAEKYEFSVQKLIYKPSKSVFEYTDPQLLLKVMRLDIFKSLSTSVSDKFKHPKLRQILEFPVIFLGATANKTPALYSLMNYADLVLGTWYPQGGMYAVSQAFYKLACELGVKFYFNTEALSINVSNGKAFGVTSNNGFFAADEIVASADYHHVEQQLLESSDRHYTEAYWQQRVMAPSALLFYIGLNTRLEGLLHHNLFFDEDFEQHAHCIYQHPSWPEKPAIYVSVASKTDRESAPEGGENVIVLIPVAPGLQDTRKIHQQYLDLVIDKLERFTGQPIRPHIVYSKTYGQSNFIADYHSFKGNAYGLANTLNQTAIFKPSITSPKVKNLFYTGQLTVPGPGVPPSIVSGQIVATEIIKKNKRN